MSTAEITQSWNICHDLTSNIPDTKYAIIVLNTPIHVNTNLQFTLNLWNNAQVRVTVDGGTQRWLDWLKFNNITNTAPPDLITGDMDSVSKDVLSSLQKQGSNLVLTPDQDETDFTKALRELKKVVEMKNIEVNTIFVLGDSWGRFDQIMANIDTLHNGHTILPNTKIILIAATSFTWLLHKGKHSIGIPNNLVKNQEWCALIPIGGPSIVTTTGLKWNLENGKLEFGHLISTSNTYNENTSRNTCVVNVEADSPIVWSMGINTLF